jgi:pilus assembly protein CpaF
MVLGKPARPKRGAFRTKLTGLPPSFDNSLRSVDASQRGVERLAVFRGPLMFTIVISEKGGAERREAFERNEVSVGRVQGNDLMLPKGNVSKHHARLLLRDTRFIVTDLKSTNGTYVNGRKIAQATLVREGDKIYIGDFVLRVEGSSPAATPPSSSRDSPRIETTGTAASPQLSPSQDTPGPATPSSQAQEVAASLPSSNAPSAVAAPVAAVGSRLPEPSAVSHYPLERDPDSESAPELRGALVPRVPGPPRLPQAAEARPRSVTGSLSLGRGGTIPPSRAKASAPGDERSSVPVPPSVGAPVSPLDRSAQRETAQHSARRLALITLIDRVAGRVDLAPLDRSPEVPDDLRERVNDVVREQANAMRADGEVPQGVDAERLARDAVGELVGLGPLGPLLEDQAITEIQVSRADRVLFTKGAETTLAEASFTNDEALARVVARLAQQAGEPMAPGDAMVERQLISGARLVAIGPPVTAAWALTIRKRRRIESSLDELVRVRALSRSMALFMEACVGARANILVVGASSGTVGTVLAALAASAAFGERMTILQSKDEIVVAGAQTTALWLTGDVDSERMVRAAARLGTDRFVVASLEGVVAVATLDVIAERSDGVLAGIGAPSLRHGLARLVAHIALARPGASVEAARELVGESFDVAVEVRRAGDGKLRVLRVAELVGTDAKGVGTRDIFVANAEGTGDAAFSVTGTIPRVAHDFLARGIRLDPSMFRKANRGTP